MQQIWNNALDDITSCFLSLFPQMNEALRLVMNGAELIAIHKGRYLKTKEGLALGPGPYVAALEFATGKTAMVVGKPEAEFFHMALGEPFSAMRPAFRSRLSPIPSKDAPLELLSLAHFLLIDWVGEYCAYGPTEPLLNFQPLCLLPHSSSPAAAQETCVTPRRL